MAASLAANLPAINAAVFQSSSSRGPPDRAVETDDDARELRLPPVLSGRRREAAVALS